MSQFDECPNARNSRRVPAENFVATLAVNVDNQKLDDAAFRQFVRNTLPIVQYEANASSDELAGSSQFDAPYPQR